MLSSVVALVPIEWETKCETKTKETQAHNKLQNAKEMSIHELHFKILVLFSAAAAAVVIQLAK